MAKQLHEIAQEINQGGNPEDMMASFYDDEVSEADLNVSVSDLDLESESPDGVTLSSDEIDAEQETSEETIEDNTEEVQDDPSADEDAPQEPSNIEELSFTDDKGRRSVEHDFSDRAKTRELVLKGLALPKFQTERDKALEQLKQVGPDPKATVEQAQMFKKIDSIYQADGYKGLLDAIDPKAYQTMKDEIIDEWEVRRKATPEELARLDADKERVELKKRLDRLEKEKVDATERAKQEAIEREFAQMESTAQSVFNKHRFAGKLNDEAQEHHLDELIWTSFDTKVRALKDELGAAPSSAQMEKILRDTLMPFRNYLKKETKTQLKTSIEKQKQSAASNVQSTIRKQAVSAKTGKQSVEEAYSKSASAGLDALFSTLISSKRK